MGWRERRTTLYTPFEVYYTLLRIGSVLYTCIVHIESEENLT